MSTATANVTIQDLEVFADNLDVKKAAAIYKEHGALIVRGLTKQYVEQIARDVQVAADTALSLLDKAQKVREGWITPDGTLFLPALAGYKRQQQIMVLACSYMSSAAMFHSAFDSKTCDIVEAILGPNVELFMNGQCLYKEPVGGHPKKLHQDAAYFQHKYEGPVATLNYVVDTDLQNGAVHVVPGSHKLGVIKHVDTFSHLGLEEKEWGWERALPVTGKAGDSIFFNVLTIHGSKENFSPKPRPVFIHRYRRADDYVVISATTTDGREVAARQIEEAKKENQRGFMVRGVRRYEERA